MYIVGYRIVNIPILLLHFVYVAFFIPLQFEF